jgi:predicted amidophosphoribosyltransferase
MHLKYLHYFGNESNESLLEAYGIIDKGIQLDQLRPKQCPNCNEPNKLDSKFCARCRMILSYDAYSQSLERQKEENMTQATVNQLSEEVFSLRQEIDDLKRQR